MIQTFTFHMRHNLLVSSIHTRFQKSHPSFHMMPMSGWIAFSTKDNSFARFLYYIVVHIYRYIFALDSFLHCHVFTLITYMYMQLKALPLSISISVKT